MNKIGSFPPPLGKLELFHFDSSHMSDKRDLAHFFQFLMLQYLLLKHCLIRGSDKILHYHYHSIIFATCIPCYCLTYANIQYYRVVI